MTIGTARRRDAANNSAQLHDDLSEIEAGFLRFLVGSLSAFCLPQAMSG